MQYKEALSELQEILEELGKEQSDIDRLESRVRRAAELIAWCRAKLRGVEEDLKALDPKLADRL
ncbi:MAG: exodeoxyribonuclease VII small subunit [Saprospiraceae bacterium]